VANEDLHKRIAEGVIGGKRADVAAACEEGIKSGVAGKDMLKHGLLVGMEEVGRRFRCEEYYIPEVLVSARALKAGRAVLQPDLATDPGDKVGRVVLGTVSGDLHDIGKNLVGIMLTGAGFEVVDLGIDVSASQFVSTAMEREADAVALSALLTTTMVNMKEVVSGLREAGFKGKVIVGGAPVSQEFADEIGADLHAADASEGAEKLRTALAAG
jgi:5-methyltetrahydrofolate--homocysteine methyltransferase